MLEMGNLKENIKPALRLHMTQTELKWNEEESSNPVLSLGKLVGNKHELEQSQMRAPVPDQYFKYCHLSCFLSTAFEVCYCKRQTTL